MRNNLVGALRVEAFRLALLSNFIRAVTERKFWTVTQNGVPEIGRNRYDVTQSEIGSLGSNVQIVGSQVANTDIATITATVALTSVGAGHQLIIAYGTRSANSAIPPTLVDSQLQAITSIVSNSAASSGGAGIYSGIAIIPSALTGTHTITIATTDISQAGCISLYEMTGIVNYATSESGASQVVITMNLTAKACGKGQISLGAGGCAPVAGTGASLAWAGGGTQGSFAVAFVDTTGFCGITGYTLGSTTPGTQDFGYARQGALCPTGTSLCGVILK